MAEVSRKVVWPKSPHGRNQRGSEIALDLIESPNDVREEDVAAILPRVVRSVVRDALRAVVRQRAPIDLDGGIEVEDVARVMPAAIRGAIREGFNAVIAEQVAVALRRHR